MLTGRGAPAPQVGASAAANSASSRSRSADRSEARRFAQHDPRLWIGLDEDRVGRRQPWQP